MKLEQADTGNIAFFISLFNLLFFLSEEFLPSHEGNCGKPIESLIFYVEYTDVIKPKEGNRPHSCCFLIFLSSISPITNPSNPRVKL